MAGGLASLGLAGTGDHRAPDRAAIDRAAVDRAAIDRPAPSQGTVALQPPGEPARIVLAEPVPRGLIDGPIRVSGFVEGGGTRLHVVAIDGHGRVLDRARLDTLPDVTGDWRPRHRFAARVAVPNPPLGGGTIWIEVVAYDERGVAIAAMTRSLRVPADGIAAPEVTPRLLGEDRLGTLGAPVPAATPQPTRNWPVGDLSWQVNPAQL